MRQLRHSLFYFLTSIYFSHFLLGIFLGTSTNFGNSLMLKALSGYFSLNWMLETHEQMDFIGNVVRMSYRDTLPSTASTSVCSFACTKLVKMDFQSCSGFQWKPSGSRCWSQRRSMDRKTEMMKSRCYISALI